MGRSNLPPITYRGTLRNYQDQLLLASMAIGVSIEGHSRMYDESKEGSNRALQRLTQTIGASSWYGVLVWAMNRGLLAMDKLCVRHPPQAYERWLEVVRTLEASPLTRAQVDVLVSYVDCQNKTLPTHWSQPDKHPAIAEILNHVGLPAAGRIAYAIVLSAAAYVRQVVWEALPAPGSTRLTAPNGVIVTLSGPPEALPQTVMIIRQALGLSANQKPG